MTVEKAFRERLHGAVLTELLRMEYWFEGKLASEVDVLFARLDDGAWVRFCFDAGVFFWREVATPDTPEAAGPYTWRILPARPPELQLGSAVEKVAFGGAEGQMSRSLAVTLGNGSGFTLQHVNDKNLLVTPTCGA